MRDKDLNAKLRLIALQLDSWRKLHELITYGLDKAKPINFDRLDQAIRHLLESTS